MTAVAIPLSPLKSISPSRFSGMRSCPLREVWTAGRAPELLPSSPSRFIGLITHKLQEEAVLGRISDPSERFDALVAEIEGDLANDPLNCRWLPLTSNVDGFNEVRQRAVEKANVEARACNPQSGARGGSRRRLGPEVRVMARDGRISGSIDRISIEAEKLVIYDEKLAEIRSSSKGSSAAKPEYATQLKMYAAMYAEDTEISDGRWPDELILRPLYGSQLVVQYVREECEELLDQAVGVLDEVNSIIISNGPAHARTQLAQPSPDVCRMCKYRPACDSYELAASSGTGWPLDLKGVVVDAEWKGNGTLSLSIECLKGLFRVRGIDPHFLTPELLASIEVGKEIAIYSLRKTQSEFTLERSRFTAFINTEREEA